MRIGICTVELYLPGITSLKEKRSIMKPLLSRLHKTFNISAAEVAHQDVWQSATIGIAVVSNSSTHARQVVVNTLEWIETNFPDIHIIKQEIEIL